MKILPLQNINRRNSNYNKPTFEAKGLYAGSFDPITNGHMDIIKRSGKLFDSLTVVVAKNPEKKEFLPLIQRLQMIKKAVSNSGLKNVLVKSSDTITAGFAKENGIDCLIRGVRNNKDFDYEMNLSRVNKLIEPSVDTIFIPANPETSALSSSAVREVYGLGGNISNMVPKNVSEFLAKSEKERTFDSELYSVLEKLGAGEKRTDGIIDEVRTQYSDSTRTYHGINHIVLMLDGFNEFMTNSPEAKKIKNADEFKFAIYMHDFINGPQNDVSASSDTAGKILRTINSDYDTAYVEELIGATDYSKPINTLNFEQKLMRDLDLLIMGQKKEVYKDYKNSVRQEYSQYTDKEFKSARQAILNNFVKEPCIYYTEYFRQQYETTARVNILNELGSLL